VGGSVSCTRHAWWWSSPPFAPRLGLISVGRIHLRDLWLGVECCLGVVMQPIMLPFVLLADQSELGKFCLSV